MISISPDGSEIYDLMLFNVTHQRKFPHTEFNGLCKSNKNTISFIGGIYELESRDEPLNGEGNFLSESKGKGYNIPLDKNGLNTLTNKKDGSFTITEMEVWEVINTE